MNENDFFERLRADARPLRYEPDEVSLARIRARIRATIERPPIERSTVAQMLAAWFRPVIATVAAVAAAAVLLLVNYEKREETSFGDQTIEVVMAGDSYSVGN